MSRYAAQALYEKKAVAAELDFMPDFTKEQMQAFLKARASARPGKSAEEFLIGLFHKKLSDLWVRLSGITRTKCAGKFTEEEIHKLCCLIKCFRVTVSGTNSFDQAQVCRGGIDTTEVDPETLESRLVPGLYFAGCGRHVRRLQPAVGMVQRVCGRQERSGLKNCIYQSYLPAPTAAPWHSAVPFLMLFGITACSVENLAIYFKRRHVYRAGNHLTEGEFIIYASHHTA